MKGLHRNRRRRPWLQRLLVLALTPGTLLGCSATYRSNRIAPGERTGLEARWKIGGVVTTEGRLLPLDQPPEAKWADIRADTLFGRAAGEPVAIPLEAIDFLWVFEPAVIYVIDFEGLKRVEPKPPEQESSEPPEIGQENLLRIVKVALLVVVLCGPLAFRKHVIR